MYSLNPLSILHPSPHSPPPHPNPRPPSQFTPIPDTTHLSSACTADTHGSYSALQVQCPDSQAAQRHVAISYCSESHPILTSTPNRTPNRTSNPTPLKQLGVGGQPGSSCRGCRLLHSWAAGADTECATGKTNPPSPPVPPLPPPSSPCPPPPLLPPLLPLPHWSDVSCLTRNRQHGVLT